MFDKVTVFFEEEFRNDFDCKVFAEILSNSRQLEVQGLGFVEKPHGCHS